MPELPEVETIVRQLAAQLPGRRIGEIMIGRLDVLHGHAARLGDATGATIRSVGREGKRIVLGLSGAGQCRLIFHLGMSGRLGLCNPEDPADRHVHLRIRLSGEDEELRFRDPRRFGGVWIDGDCSDPWRGRGLARLGPDPLAVSFRQFEAILGRRRQIKALLMDQAMLAGLGNIYCDESLHLARIHPLRRADGLTAEEGRRLLRAIRRVLRSAIRRRGSSIIDYRDAAGESGDFQRFHRVYGRAGDRCLTCRREIVRRRVIAGRSTHFCPRCQPEG